MTTHIFDGPVPPPGDGMGQSHSTPVTTLAVGEEGGYEPPTPATTAIGEDGVGVDWGKGWGAGFVPPSARKVRLPSGTRLVLGGVVFVLDSDTEAEAVG